ncbi:MAG TPA: calcium-binding protein [Spirochaetia bacterium]|nr:calcium-binding protein [Spirochaetia bacterium]
MAEFKPGDSVRIKEEVMSPDIEGQCIGGWQGRVLEVIRDFDGEVTVIIELDSETLREMSPFYIYECRLSFMDCLIIELPSENIEPAVSRDTEEDTMMAAGDVKLIMELLLNGDSLAPTEFYQVWTDYLTRILIFPFKAKVSKCQVEHHFQQGDSVNVRAIDSVDERYGLIAEVWDGRDKFYFPLCSLEVADKESPDYVPVEDYRTWFADYCESEPDDS